MTRHWMVRFIYGRRLTVDGLTAIATLMLALAAFTGTADALQLVLMAAILMAVGAMVEPRAMAFRRRSRRVGHSAPSSPIPA